MELWIRKNSIFWFHKMSMSLPALAVLFFKSVIDNITTEILHNNIKL